MSVCVCLFVFAFCFCVCVSNAAGAVLSTLSSLATLYSVLHISTFGIVYFPRKQVHTLTLTQWHSRTHVYVRCVRVYVAHTHMYMYVCMAMKLFVCNSYICWEKSIKI